MMTSAFDMPTRAAGRHPLSQDHGHQLVTDAVLAASSHNTQPWNFTLSGDAVGIAPDHSRRCPVVDPDDHHLFASLGCAAENILTAAPTLGLQGCWSFDATAWTGAITFEPIRAVAGSPRARALRDRQCTRTEYDARSVPARWLERLEVSGTSDSGGIILLTDARAIDSVCQLVVEANTVQLHDAQFVDELCHWIRFNRSEAIRTGDGLYGRTLGIPSVPRWAGALAVKYGVPVQTQNRVEIRRIRSSSGIAVFFSYADVPASWCDAGRRYERFALDATAMGLKNAFINQPVEVPRLREQLQTRFGLKQGRADFVVRFGYGPPQPRSFRRSPEAVLAGG
jgi:hypothetical protein